MKSPTFPKTKRFSLWVPHVDETKLEVRKQFYNLCHYVILLVANTFTESFRSLGIVLAFLRVQGYIGATSAGGKFKDVRIIYRLYFGRPCMFTALLLF
jgi:hypothetical protein